MVRTFVLLAVLWWSALLLQVWFAWDLSEAYASMALLLFLGPETVFGALGAVVMLIGMIACYWRRAWVAEGVGVATLFVAIWVAVDAPIFDWGTRIFLWRHEFSFLVDVQAMDSSVTETDPLHPVATPSGRLVYVERQPTRIAFERRSVGMFHWAAIVHDPSGTIEADVQRRRDIFGGWTPLGCYKLWDHWFYVVAMK